MATVGKMMNRAITACRACNAQLGAVVADLGQQPPSNAYLASVGDIGNERRYPLRVRLCSACTLVQLDYVVAPEELFRDYSYFSSYSDEWMSHARRYSDMAIERFGLGRSSLVIELASNDGYLLRNFLPHGIPVLGIDPSDTVAEAAAKLGVPTLVEFFGAAVAKRLADTGRTADLIIANNVLAHVPDVNDFVEGIAILLKRGGVATLEFPHLLKLVLHREFDTIYHEHYSYFSLLAVEKLFQRHGLAVFDVDELPTHGGSLRVYATRTRDREAGDTARLLKVRNDELIAGLGSTDAYTRFAKAVEECRIEFREFVEGAKASGKTVAAYGAAAKGNTLLNYCGATVDEIRFVADRNPNKQSKLLPGTHIPIVSPATLLDAKPDYVLILPWNLKTEVMGQLQKIRDWGGRFVTAVPRLEVAE